MKELNDFLDEQYQVNEEQKEAFRITDASLADWALRKIKKAKNQIEENNLLANEKIDLIEQWQKKANKSLQSDIDYFTSLLKLYAEEKRAADEKYSSENLPTGSIRFRKQRAKVTVDETGVEWMKKNGHSDLIVTEEKIKIADVKKRFEVRDTGVFDPETGERVEGSSVTVEPDKFEAEV